MSTVTTKLRIPNDQGMHAKPAMIFGEVASRFACRITVARVDSGATVDGKSGLGMLTLMLTQGTEIEISASGEQAQQAIDTLAELVRSGFAPPR